MKVINFLRVYMYRKNFNNITTFYSTMEPSNEPKNVKLGLWWSWKHRKQRVKGVCLFNETHSAELKQKISYNSGFNVVLLDTDVFNQGNIDNDYESRLVEQYKSAVETPSDKSLMNSYRMEIARFQKALVKSSRKRFQDKSIVVVSSDPTVFKYLGIKPKNVKAWVLGGSLDILNDKFFNNELNNLYRNVETYDNIDTMCDTTIAFLKK